jgi:putative glycosyltransferase
MFHSAPYLTEFYQRVRSAVEQITQSFEIIFVNDASPDSSLDIALDFMNSDNRVRVIDLSRNFGHYKAIMTGLAHARGELIFLIDCDLEESPESLTDFYELMKGLDADVVFGVQMRRKGGKFERISGSLFYRLFNLIAEHPIQPSQVVARLMTKQYVASLLLHREREVFIDGLWGITGFKQIPCPIVKQHKGETTYNLTRKIEVFVNAVTSFSNKPLIFTFYLGCLILLASTIAALYLIVRIILFEELLMGWPSLIVSIWLLGGLTIFCLGVLGIYLSKIFVETKQRPYTIVRRIYEREGDGQA